MSLWKIIITYKFPKGPLIKYVLSNKPTFLLLLFGIKLEWKRIYSQFELLVLQLSRVLFVIIFPRDNIFASVEQIPLDKCLCIFFVIIAIVTFLWNMKVEWCLSMLFSWLWLQNFLVQCYPHNRASRFVP